MPRSIRLADRLGAVAGIVFTVLMFITVAAVDPLRGVSDQELQSWWADSGNRDGYVISMYAMLVACPLFLVFVSRLRTRLQSADATNWADTMFAFGIVTTAALGVCAVIRGVIAASIRFEDEPLPGVDTLRFQTSLAFAAWDLVILFAAVLVAIVSIMAIATHALPRWLGLLGAVVALGSIILLTAHSAPFSLPLIYIWVLATSVQLLREPFPEPVGGQAWRPEVSRTQT